MVKTRTRREDPPPGPDCLLLRGILASTGLELAELRETAIVNHDLYGFYGVSVWLAADDQERWSRYRTGSGLTPMSTARSIEMISIDLPADLNLEDDEGRNVARLGDAVGTVEIRPGVVVVAGAPRAWSWAVVDAVEDGYVYFRQVSARQAAQHGSLVAPAR